MRKKIYILLTRFPDNGSKILEFLTGCHYCHAAIGLGEDMNHFYSFKKKGFIIEEITRYLKPNRTPFACQLYQIEVSGKIYGKVKHLLEHFAARKNQMHYSNLGVVLSLMRIPFKRPYHYFCSQFVAEVLMLSRAAKLKKSSTLYLPGDLRKLAGVQLVFHGNMRDFAQRFRLSAARI